MIFFESVLLISSCCAPCIVVLVLNAWHLVRSRYQITDILLIFELYGSAAYCLSIACQN